MRNKRRDPWAEKFGFSDKEWTLFQARLTHAEKAIEMLLARAPEVFERVFHRSATNPNTHALSAEAQQWIDCVIADLLHVHRQRPTRAKPAKATLGAKFHVVARRKR